MKHFAPQLSSSRSAFTIIELLTVMTIMAVLMAVSVPALRNLTESSNLTRSGQIVSDQVGLARQLAAAKNKAVEVRLIKSDADSPSGYNSIQLWISDESGSYKSANRLVSLPKNMVISEQPSISAAFATSNGLSGTNTMPTNAGTVSNKKYAAFQVRPSGTITPALTMSNATLTILSSQFATNSSLPKNYVTIQINPLTSTPLVYRP